MLQPNFSNLKQVHIFYSYPPGSKCKALRLRVHLILLYFIRILFWVRRLFFYFVGMGVDVGVGGGLFLCLNLIIIIWYILQVYMYAKGIVAQQKSYGF